MERMLRRDMREYAQVRGLRILSERYTSEYLRSNEIQVLGMIPLTSSDLYLYVFSVPTRDEPLNLHVWLHYHFRMEEPEVAGVAVEYDTEIDMIYPLEPIEDRLP